MTYSFGSQMCSNLNFFPFLMLSLLYPYSRIYKVKKRTLVTLNRQWSKFTPLCHGCVIPWKCFLSLVFSFSKMVISIPQVPFDLKGCGFSYSQLSLPLKLSLEYFNIQSPKLMSWYTGWPTLSEIKHLLIFNYNQTQYSMAWIQTYFFLDLVEMKCLFCYQGEQSVSGNTQATTKTLKSKEKDLTFGPAKLPDTDPYCQFRDSRWRYKCIK